MSSRWGDKIVPIVSGAIVSAVLVGVFHYTFFRKKSEKVLVTSQVSIQQKPEECIELKQVPVKEVKKPEPIQAAPPVPVNQVSNVIADIDSEFGKSESEVSRAQDESMRDIELVESKTIDPSVSQESIPKPKPGSKNTSFSEDTVIKEDIVRTPKKGEKQSASPPRAESRRLQDARKRAEDVKATTPKKLDHKTLEDSIAASNKKIEEAKAEVIIKKSSRSRASSSSSAAKISRENSRAEEEQRAELKKALTLPDKQPAEEKKQSAAAQSLGVKRSVTNLLPSPSSDRIFNFVMLGAHGCGKTSFLSRISTGAVPRTTSPSKVTSHKDKVIIGQSTGTKVRVRFTDIADKDFSRRAPLANGLIFFVDLTNKESLQAAIELNTQFTDLMEEKGQLFDIKKIIVATKSDATNKSLQVAGKLIQSFASSIFATVVPVSAQTGDGFTEFESLLTECV